MKILQVATNCFRRNAGSYSSESGIKVKPQVLILCDMENDLSAHRHLIHPANSGNTLIAFADLTCAENIVYHQS